MRRVGRELHSQDGNDEHIGSHQEGTEKKRPPAADALDEEEQEEEACHDLDETKEAGQQ